MQDRIPGAPGQYAMKIDSESLHKFLNAEECTVVLQRDDHPIVEGTPLNKATFLPDDLAAELCPDIEDPTPADAVRKLARKTNGAYTATESEEYPGCYYRTVDGVTEWLNPPMVPGVEYRTTERFNGKPLYAQTFNMGAMPNNETKIIQHGIADMEYVPFRSATSPKGYAFPVHWPDNNVGNIQIYVNKTQICVYASTNWSATSCIVELKYTKTTD